MRFSAAFRKLMTLLVVVLFGLSLIGVAEAKSGKKRPRQNKAKQADQMDSPKKINRYKRFKQGHKDIHVDLGWGAGVNIPPDQDRTDWEFVYLAPTLKWNLTGPIGKSFYRGSLYWLNEITLLKAYNPEGAFLAGWSPVMAEYKFLWPKVDWAPYIFGGGGFSGTNMVDANQREISGHFQFLLQAGAGVEFYKTTKGAWSLNYRFFHVSNAGMKKPNIGINTNVFSVGYSF